MLNSILEKFNIGTSREPRTALAPGDFIQKYHIQKQMSKGGFSWVYKALAPDAKPVFIKEFFPHTCVSRNQTGNHVVVKDKEATYKESMRRFIDEGRMLASFRVTGFPRLRELVWEKNIPAMIFEWERGRTLAQYLRAKHGFIPEETIRRYTYGFLRLLKKMHAEQILHLDLHPANLFFRLDGKPVILDFGCAKHLGDLSLFSGPIRMYTHGYTPPEIIQKGGMVGPWSDLYMIGACLKSCRVLEPKGEYSPELVNLTQSFLRKNPLDRPNSIDDPMVQSFMIACQADFEGLL